MLDSGSRFSQSRSVEVANTHTAAAAAIRYLNDRHERDTTTTAPIAVRLSKVCRRGRRHNPGRAFPYFLSYFVVVLRHDISQFFSIRLVNKRTRAKLSPEPLDLTPIPNKGQLFVVASALGWFVAIIRSNTGLGTFIVRRSKSKLFLTCPPLSSYFLSACGPSVTPILSGRKI